MIKYSRLITTYIFLMMCLIMGCEKNEDPVINVDLAGYWSLLSFEGLALSDTLYQDMYILFREDGIYRDNEFEGKSLNNMFYGVFNVVGENLELNELQVTENRIISDKIETIERNYFNALSSVNKIERFSDTLKIYYEDSKKSLLFVKRDYIDNLEFFMEAKINGQNWNANKLDVDIDYDHYQNEFHWRIKSDSNSLLPDGIRYLISLSINKTPNIGVYKCNYDGVSPTVDGGVSGVCNGWEENGTDNYFLTYSTTGGDITINYLSRTKVEGTFNFTTYGANFWNEKREIVITEGSFLALKASSSGKPWFVAYESK